MSLKKNLIANYLGQGWTALMSLAFIPLYIKYLGIESYGLIGLFAILQAWLVLLDMGMTPTLGREMARFTGGANDTQHIRDLLRSIEIIAFGIAILIVISIWLSSGWLASDWLKAEKIPIATVAQAFSTMGIVVALRFIESIYHSSMIGLQRQVLFNIINSTINTLRGGGAVIILAFISPTITAFFIWQASISIINLFILSSATYYTLPKISRTGRFSLETLKSIWKFSKGMMGITFLSLLLMQTDKIVLTKLLTLSEYGHYALATVVAGALYMLITPIGQAWHPRLNEIHAQKNQQEFHKIYHQGAQLVSVIMGSTAIILILFSKEIIWLWTGDVRLAQQIAVLVSILTLGNLLNGLMWIPYQAQLAYAWTGFATWSNIIAVLIIVPAIFLVAPNYGAEGAAWIWVGLNMSYVFIGINIMHLKILPTEKWDWYIYDITLPLGTATIVALLAKKIISIEHFSPFATVVVIGLTSCIVLLSASLSAPLIRQKIQSLPWIQLLMLRGR